MLKQVQVRRLSNNLVSLRLNGPRAVGSGIMNRIGTSNIVYNDVTCTGIRRGDKLMESAQMRMDRFGSYIVATTCGDLYEGTYSTMIRKGSFLQFGYVKVYFSSKKSATKAFRQLKGK